MDNAANGSSANYYGAGNSNDYVGGSTYQITALSGQRRTEGGSTYLDVYIDTNFTAQYSNDRGGIDYGDLFITTGDQYDPASNSKNDVTFDSNPGRNSSYNRASELSTDTRWQYAFDINNSNDRWGSIGSSGALKEIDVSSDRKYAWSLETAKEFNNSRDGRANQAVKLYDNSWGVSNTGNSGSWSNNIGGGQNGANNRITFSFEVTDTILATTSQLAFRWAMTCANDIVEGLTSFKGGKPPGPSVPEPSTIVLMALAMAGLIYRRKTV